MNERIKELAEQATSTLPVNHEGYGSKGYIEQVEYFDKEKFAELIVGECVNVGLEQKKQVEEMEVYNLQDEVWNRARVQQSQHIVDKIKQHFGVEE